MNLSQKEASLLGDLKEQELICIEKYAKYAGEASDNQLKNLFTQLGRQEEQHLSTIEQIMNGNVPATQSGGGGNGQQQQQQITPTYSYYESDQNKQKDSYLCTDALSTEKHVSSVYNTGIFEFKDTAIREALNHIQKEEQQHGERIYNYMDVNGMYR
jgi:spore coat protein CotF